jgi:hypothetical protein
MVLQCKKSKLIVTGEVFPLDIGLLMGGLLMGAVMVAIRSRSDISMYY